MKTTPKKPRRSTRRRGVDDYLPIVPKHNPYEVFLDDDYAFSPEMLIADTFGSSSGFVQTSIRNSFNG